ncbi:MAG: plastocyanin/azurin family copper-binding protein [Haloarculaceae archaeon]
MRHTRRSLLHAVAVGSVALAGCSGIGTTGNDEGSGSNSDSLVKNTAEVSMTGSEFKPRNIHVDAGTTVTWTNEDSFEHTVTSASDNWQFDASVPGGEQTQYTFEESGVYGVYCAIHGGPDLTGMSMKVGVGEATIRTPLGGETDDASSGNDGGGAY